MNFYEILTSIIGVLLLIVGYFSRTSFTEMKIEQKLTRSDLTKAYTEIGKLKSELRIIEIQSQNDVKSLKDLTISQFKGISEQLDRMERLSSHTEGTLKTNNELFAKILESKRIEL
jgi:hypothetical protein